MKRMKMNINVTLNRNSVNDHHNVSHNEVHNFRKLVYFLKTSFIK